MIDHGRSLAKPPVISWAGKTVTVILRQFNGSDAKPSNETFLDRYGMNTDIGSSLSRPVLRIICTVTRFTTWRHGAKLLPTTLAMRPCRLDQCGGANTGPTTLLTPCVFASPVTIGSGTPCKRAWSSPGDNDLGFGRVSAPKLLGGARVSIPAPRD
jgi:hypothetical protein